MVDNREAFAVAITRLNAALDVLTGLQSFLADPPQADVATLTPAQLTQRTNQIGKLLSRLGYDSSLIRPAVNVSEGLPARVMGHFAKDALSERLLSLVAALEGQLSSYVAALDPETAFDAGFIRTRDFGPNGTLILTLTPHSGPMQLAVGKYRSLPANHPLLDSIREPYRLEGHHWNNLEIVALGPPLPVIAGQAIPRPVNQLAEV